MSLTERIRQSAEAADLSQDDQRTTVVWNMDRWGVLRRFGQTVQANVPAAAAEAAEEPKREDPGPPLSLPRTAERPLNGDYGSGVAMAPPKPLIQPLELQPGNVVAGENGMAVGFSDKPQTLPLAIARPRVYSKGDYLGISHHPRLEKLLARYGDSKLLFADKVLKFTGTGKAKRRGLIITDFAIYLFDPETDALKRRIVLKAVNRLYLSELMDNFLALIVPSEYDCLLASARKKEIAQVVAEATSKGTGGGVEVEITFSNSFEYRPSFQVVKEVVFEDLEGGTKTRILRKKTQRG